MSGMKIDAAKTVLVKCPKCGRKLKTMVFDFPDDSLQYCPGCDWAEDNSPWKPQNSEKLGIGPELRSYSKGRKNRTILLQVFKGSSTGGEELKIQLATARKNKVRKGWTTTTITGDYIECEDFVEIMFQILEASKVSLPTSDLNAVRKTLGLKKL